MPNIIGRISNAEELRNRERNSTSPDIKIAGMPTRKESLAAVILSIPENNAKVKVTPDLETPGKIARDCEIPNKIISFRLILENDFFLLPKISARASNKDITIETVAMENNPLKFESEKPGQNNLMNNPTNNIGIVATKI